MGLWPSSKKHAEHDWLEACAPPVQKDSGDASNQENKKTNTVQMRAPESMTLKLLNQTEAVNFRSNSNFYFLKKLKRFGLFKIQVSNNP